MAGADLRAAFVARCLRGALPPVDLRAVGLLGTSHVAGVLFAQESGIYLLYLLPFYLVGGIG